MNERDRVLTQILAHTDARFRPLRSTDWTSPGPTNLWQARQDFLTGGVGLNAGGSEASRKDRQRLLDDLVSGGLITKSGSGKAALYRLTEQGEAHARTVCGLPSLIESHEYLIEIIGGECETAHGPLTPEYILLGESNYQQTDEFTIRIFDLEMFLLPGLVHNWLTAKSDILGRVYFIATERGREAARQSPPTRPANLPFYDESAANLYFESRAAVRSQLRMAKPKNPSEIGFCPLPVSISFPPRKPTKENADVAN